MITNKTDITIKTYYLNFIRNAQKNYIKQNKVYKRILNSKNNTYKYLLENKYNIKDLLKINLDNFEEFNKNEYNSDEYLLNNINSKYKNSNDNRELILQIIKYCNLLRAENTCKYLINKYDIEMNLKNREYEYLLSKFFYKMHEQLLNGDVYKLGHGVGQMYIIRKYTSKESKRIDFDKTNKRKKYLLENGYKIYNKEEAEKCKAMGVEYNGIDYRVKLNNPYVDCIYIDNSKYWDSRKYVDIKYIDYMHPSFKNKTYGQIAEENKKISDIYDLRMSIKRKLSILLINFPQQGLNYFRQ